MLQTLQDDRCQSFTGKRWYWPLATCCRHVAIEQRLLDLVFWNVGLIWWSSHRSRFALRKARVSLRQCSWRNCHETSPSDHYWWFSTRSRLSTARCPRVSTSNPSLSGNTRGHVGINDANKIRNSTCKWGVNVYRLRVRRISQCP